MLPRAVGGFFISGKKRASVANVVPAMKLVLAARRAMAKQSKAQKETIHRVMHEFKEGDLRTSGTGPKVKNPRQAVAIALQEAGASNQETPQKNKENLRKTKSREKSGTK
jgi:Family of unknown function (DUF6496)